jgi:hypothetical protein
MIDCARSAREAGSRIRCCSAARDAKRPVAQVIPNQPAGRESEIMSLKSLLAAVAALGVFGGFLSALFGSIAVYRQSGVGMAMLLLVVAPIVQGAIFVLYALVGFPFYRFLLRRYPKLF